MPRILTARDRQFRLSDITDPMDPRSRVGLRICRTSTAIGSMVGNAGKRMNFQYWVHPKLMKRVSKKRRKWTGGIQPMNVNGTKDPLRGILRPRQRHYGRICILASV